MASISKVSYETYEVYRIRLKKKGLPTLTLTFDDLESAANWLDANEDAYLADPIAFLAKQKEITLFMRRHMLKSMNGMRRPPLRGR